MRIVKRVECMEELLLSGFLSSDELDIVHQKNVHVAIFIMEGFRRSALDGCDQLIGEAVSPDIENFQFRPGLSELILDRVQKVCFAKSGRSVNEQRIVGIGRVRGDRDGGSMGETVVRSDNEIVESVGTLPSR